MKFKKYLSILIIVFTFFSVSAVLAAPLIDSGKISNQTDAFREGAGFAEESVGVGSLAATIISALLSLLGIIFLGLMIYAGYNWMTASGDEEKIKKSKDTIIRAVIGLVIVLSAYAITYFVFNNFFTGEFSSSGGAGTGAVQEQVGDGT